MDKKQKLKELRDRVAKLERNVARKIARYEHEGVSLRDSKYNPLRRGKAGRYTEKQLNSYIKSMELFTSRKTQFVGISSQGVPVTVEKWRKYKKAEGRHNKQVRELVMKFDDRIDHHGMKPSERQSMNRSVKFGNTVNNPRAEFNRKPIGITSEKSLDKLIRDVARKSTPEYIQRELREKRKQIREMLNDWDFGEIGDRIAKLTDEQFEYFWVFSPKEVNDFFLVYDSILDQHGIRPGGVKYDLPWDEIGASSESSLGTFLDWVEDNVTPEGNKRKKRVRRRSGNNRGRK